MQGLTPFETWDETYVHKNNNPDRVVLQERVEGDRREAWTWVRNEGQGRVFYTAYGHDERTWKQPAFQALVRNGIIVGGRRPRARAVGAAQARAARLPGEQPHPELRAPQPAAQAPGAALSRGVDDAHPGAAGLPSSSCSPSEPDIVKPIAMAWDERGRLWIAETIDYPNDIHPGRPGRDRIKILEDTNGDGKADKFTVFADSLNIPTSLVFSNGGMHRRRTCPTSSSSRTRTATTRPTCSRRCSAAGASATRTPARATCATASTTGSGARSATATTSRVDAGGRLDALRAGDLPLPPDDVRLARARRELQQQHVGPRLLRDERRVRLDGEQHARDVRRRSRTASSAA